jgi:hypothetical protein
MNYMVTLIDFNFKLMAIWNSKNTSNGESKKHINQGPYAMVEGKKAIAKWKFHQKYTL